MGTFEEIAHNAHSLTEFVNQTYASFFPARPPRLFPDLPDLPDRLSPLLPPPQLKKIAPQVSENCSPPGEGGPLDNLDAYGQDPQQALFPAPTAGQWPWSGLSACPPRYGSRWQLAGAAGCGLRFTATARKPGRLPAGTLWQPTWHG